ncbi:hypothetical protein F5Y16DRAFT_383739 [Xylariaceae sp. FL0255]|nr:hypothetical protein F5Y16DRAFT_383739 [Xylariaceae sp. FL0255]
MAGHNFSGYMSSLLSALFAPFTFLFSRILHFFPWPIQKYTATSEYNSTLPEPAPGHHGFASLAPASTPEAETEECTLPSPSSPSARPATVHHHQLLHTTTAADRDLLDTYSAAGSSSDNNKFSSDQNNCNADLSNPDLPFASSSSFHNSQQHVQPDNMPGKRGGQKRGGSAKASTLRPGGAPVTVVTDTNGNDRPAPVGQLENITNGHTKSIPYSPNGSKPIFASPKQGGPRGPDRPQSDRQKENVALPVKSPAVHRTLLPTPPAQTPLVITDDAARPEQPATRSYPAVAIPRGLSISNLNVKGNDKPIDSSADAGQLTAIANRLTLEDTAPSPKSASQGLGEATAAAEASAVPVPLVVAVPLPPQLKTPEPDVPPTPMLPGLIEPKTPEEKAEREHHLKYMREALDMGLLALNTNETPVGCVLVYHGKTIAKGMNATNITRNGTRHAEFMALSALLSRREPTDVKMSSNTLALDDASWGDVDPKDGHIYPYGQKLHPAPVVDRSIISECILYVTVEPCVMCASLLRQLGIKKVYFGAVNDKFGGTGGVFRVHMNSKPVSKPEGRPYQRGYGPQDIESIAKGKALALPREDDDGDGGNVESGYPVEGGYLRDDAVSLLRRFYVQENGRAPQPRKKEGRAARLYASMENQGKNGNVSDSSEVPETPVDAEPPAELNGSNGPIESVKYSAAVQSFSASPN